MKTIRCMLAWSLALAWAGVTSGQTIPALPELAAAPAADDLFYVVDIDATPPAAGTGKKLTTANLFLFKFPASSTDNAIARFDGTTGTLQDSGLTVADVTGSSVTVATTAGNALAVAATAPAAANGASQAGKAVSVTASAAVASLDTAGAAAGGAITITSGAAARNTSGNADGGDITFAGGAGIGTGTAGQVLFPSGVVGAPSISLSADPDTGLYAHNTDVLGFASGGVRRFSVDTSGAVVLGRLYGNTTGTIEGFVEKFEAVTTTKTPSAGEEGECYNNTGDADGASLTLDNNPVQGVRHCAAVTVAQTLTVAPSAGETLYMGTDQCVASMTANAIGATADFVAVTGGSGGVWMAFGASGWTCND